MRYTVVFIGLLFLTIASESIAQIDRPGLQPGKTPEETKKDTSYPVEISTWKTDRYFNLINTGIDTTWHELHLFNPAYGNAYLSSYGSPIQHNLFNQRFDDPFIFKRHYLDYYYTENTTQYYRTTAPFTFFKYNSGGSSDKVAEVEVFHTQNVNQHLNFGLRLKFISSSRFYEQDDQKTIRSNFVTFFSSYNRDLYNAYFNVNANTVKAIEIGGIQNKEEFRQGIQEIFTTYLENANSMLRSRSLHFSQEVKLRKGLFSEEKADTLAEDTTMTDSLANNLPQSDTVNVVSDTTKGSEEDTVPTDFALIHNLDYFSDEYRYTDENPISQFYSAYPIFIDSNRTNDRAETAFLSNELILSFKYRGFKLKAGLRHELNKYYFLEQNKNVDTATVYRWGSKVINNSQFIGRTDINFFKNYHFEGEVGYYLTGYKRFDTYADAALYRIGDSSRISIAARYDLKEPHFYYKRYSSNHFQWNQNLRKTQTLQGTLNYHDSTNNFFIDLNAKILKDYVYLNEAVLPSQNNTYINLSTLSVRKEFVFWKIHLDNNLNYQYTSNRDVINIPEWYIKESLSFRHTFKFDFTGGKLQSQIGLSMYYFPEYYADAYMPSLNLFYNQKEEKIGGKVYFDAFVNLKIKRTSAFLKLSHVNSPLQTRDYYAAPEYPMSPLMLKFGVFWSFYD